MIHQKRFFLIIFIWCITSFCFAAEELLLKYDLKIGDVINYQFEIEIEEEIIQRKEAVETSGKLETKTSAKTHLKCLKKEKGNIFAFELGFDAFEMEKILRVDSEKKQKVVFSHSGVKLYENAALIESKNWDEIKDEGTLNVKKLLQTKLKYKFNSRGEIVEFIDEEKVGKEFPGFDFTPFLLPQIVFPDTEIEIGSEWNNVKQRKLPKRKGDPFSGEEIVTEDISTLNNLKKVKEHQCAEISTVSISKLKNESKQMQLERKLEGKSYIDVQSGKLVSMEGIINRKLVFIRDKEKNELRQEGKGKILITLIE